MSNFGALTPESESESEPESESETESEPESECLVFRISSTAVGSVFGSGSEDYKYSIPRHVNLQVSTTLAHMHVCARLYAPAALTQGQRGGIMF